MNPRIDTCDRHGNDCYVIYSGHTCPVCQTEADVEQLNDKIESLEDQVSALKEQLDDAQIKD